MGTDESSKGRAWFGKIYNKLEKILVEVDTFTSQNTLCLNSDDDPSGWESVRSEPEEAAEDHSSEKHGGGVASPSCKSADDPPSHQKFDMEQFEEEDDGLKENLSASDGEYWGSNRTSTITTLGDDEEPIKITDQESPITNTLNPQKVSDQSVDEVRAESLIDSFSTESTQTCVEILGIEEECSDEISNLNPVATKIPEIPVQDYVADTRSFNEVNLNDVYNDKSQVAQLDSKVLYGMAFQEDNALYAVRVRTKKLRSYKRKILDALTSKRRREKEYEHIPIWFGDADMGSDLVTGVDSKAMASQNSQLHEAEDSQWELL